MPMVPTKNADDDFIIYSIYSYDESIFDIAQLRCRCVVWGAGQKYRPILEMFVSESD